jgi:hypothetical protein
MFKRGEVYENPVTADRAVIRVGTDENAGAHLVVDLYIRPGGAVAGEHVHPSLHERFTVWQGRVGFAIGEEICCQAWRNFGSRAGRRPRLVESGP